MFDRANRFIASIGVCSVMALWPTVTLDAAPPPSFQGLGDLPGNIFFSVANGISADGVVVVGRSVGASGTRAFRWTAEGGMVSLGEFWQSQAWATSTDGAVIVGQSGLEAFRWTDEGGTVSLGTLPGTSPDSIARGMTADGAVVVGRSGDEAFVWAAGSGMFTLGDLPGGSVSGQAFAMSAESTVIVGASSSFASGFSGTEAFRWTPVDRMVGLVYHHT